MPLMTYTDLEINEYVSYWGAMNSDAYNVLASLNILSDEVYSKIISALISGLVTFSDIKALFVINNTVVSNLIYSKLDDTDIDAVAWRYRTDYLINHARFNIFKSESIGDKNTYARRIAYDIFSYIYVPQYDSTGVDESKYVSFDEVRAAYEAASRTATISNLIAKFNQVRQYTSNYLPVSVPLEGTDCVKEAVLSCLTNPWFIYSQTGPTGDIWDVCEILISEIYEQVPPHLFIKHTNNMVSYAMAEKIDSDTLLNGYPGMRYLRDKTLWHESFTYIDDSFMEYLSKMYIAKYYLPRMYDELYPNDEVLYEVLLNYLRIARITILEIAKNIITMIADPVIVRKTLLAPLGLLFLVSGVSFYDKS